MRILRESPVPLSIAEVARGLGVHPNTARFHLDVLAEGGRVEEVPSVPSGPGRPPRAFRAHRGMDPAGPRNYRLLAGILADDMATRPDSASRAAEAGRAWGAREAAPHGPAGAAAGRAVEDLVELLDRLGFAPERGATAPRQEIRLRNCPFLDLAQSRAHVVCPVHLGLMQGALAALDAPVTVDRLEPFREPDLCLAQLGPRSHP